MAATAPARIPALVSRCRVPVWLSACLVALLYVTLAGPLVTESAENLRILDTFSSDEPFVVINAKCMVDRGTPLLRDCTQYVLEWPRLSLYALMGIAYPARALFRLDYGNLILIGRFLSFFAGLGTVLLTLILGVRLFGSLAGLLAGVFLVLTPAFLQWSLTIHPDALQLLLVLCTLLAVRRVSVRGLRSDVLAACALAGLAFSTKYAGVFLLPAAALALAFKRTGEHAPARAWRTTLPAILGEAVLGGLVFAAAYLACTPEFWAEPASIVRSLSLTGWGLSTKGYGGSSSGGHPDPVAWLSVIASPGVLGPIVSVLAVLAFIWAATRLRWATAAPLLLPVALLASFLAIGVSYISGAHFLPAVPVVLVFVAGGVVSGGRRLARARSAPLAVSLLAICLALTLTERSVAAREFLAGVASRSGTPEAAVGRWIEENFPPETHILYDQYIYVPPQFTEAERSWGMTQQEVDRSQPDLIVVNDHFHTRYDAGRRQESYIGDREQFVRASRFYAGLSSGSVAGYFRLADFGYVTVYGRAGSVGLAKLASEIGGEPGTETGDSVFLPLSSRDAVAPFLDVRGRFGFWENERSLAFPANRGHSAWYLLPPSDSAAAARFVDKWGAFMNHAEQWPDGLKALWIEAARLPKAERAAQWLTQPGFPIPPHATPRLSFENGLTLLGYRIENETVGPERPLKATLLWNVTAPTTPAPFQVNVSLLDKELRVVSTVTEPPLGGGARTEAWQPGDVVLDRVTLPIIDCTIRGPHSLRISPVESAQVDGAGRAYGQATVGPVQLASDSSCVGITGSAGR